MALKFLAAIVLLRVVGVLPRRSRDWLDAFSAWVLNGWLTVAVAGVCVLCLVTWMPHYLTWPWFVDTEQFAVSALSWDSGLVPYRDLPDFDFPGPIYLCYLLGKAFGWGDTVPFNAIDATFLVLLGIALAAWSRRLFRSMLPGLAGYLPFLCIYLSMDILQVGQRDWHGPLFAILGLLAQQARPGRAGRVAAALGLAAGLCVSPPGCAAAARDDPGRGRGAAPTGRALGPGHPAPRRMGRDVGRIAAPGVWSLDPPWCVLDDFLLRLRVARYGGTYNQATFQSFLGSLNTELVDPLTVMALGTGAVLSCAGPAVAARAARPWLLATLGALLYKPISPVQHLYLYQPLRLICSIALALPVAWLLAAPRLIAPLRLAAVVAVIIVCAALPRVL